MRNIKKCLLIISLLFLILPLGACATKKDFFVQFYVSGELVDNMYLNSGEVIEKLPEYKSENITILGWYDEVTNTQVKTGTIVADNMIVKARTSYHITKNSDTWLDKSVVDELKKHYQIKVSTSGTYYLNEFDIEIFNESGVLSFDFTESSIANNTFPQFAFANNDKIKQVSLPLSITAIGQSAFNNCINLSDVDMNNNIRIIENHAFYNCDSLIVLTLPSETTNIGDFAFAECTNLTILNIGAKVTALSSNFVDGATSLTNINVFNNTKYFSVNGILYMVEVGSIEFSETTTYKLIRCPEGKTGNVSIIPKTGIILEYSFRNCKKLTKVNLSNDNSLLYEIKEGAFYNCTSLNEVVLSNTLKSIGKSAFENCFDLKKINFLSSPELLSIGDFAFKNCYSLTYVVFGDKLSTIGEAAFFNCENLLEVQIGTVAANTLLSIGNFAFYKNLYLYDTIFTILGDAIPTIGELSFGNAMPLSGDNNPNNVKIYVNDKNACVSMWSGAYDNIGNLLHNNE